jgi:PPOX class probable F420-dependent enzyme
VDRNLPDTHADLLAAPDTAVLLTVGADGQPQSTAAWYLVDDDGVLKTSILTSRQKHENLARNPKATPFILDPATPYRSLEIRAAVELTPDPDGALVPQFAARYGVLVEVLAQAGADRVVAALHPVRVRANG